MVRAGDGGIATGFPRRIRRSSVRCPLVVRPALRVSDGRSQKRLRGLTRDTARSLSAAIGHQPLRHRLSDALETAASWHAEVNLHRHPGACKPTLDTEGSTSLSRYPSSWSVATQQVKSSTEEVRCVALVIRAGSDRGRLLIVVGRHAHHGAGHHETRNGQRRGRRVAAGWSVGGCGRRRRSSHVMADREGSGWLFCAQRRVPSRRARGWEAPVARADCPDKCRVLVPPAHGPALHRTAGPHLGQGSGW